MLYLRRMSSWFRRAKRPDTTIEEEYERKMARPWEQEQMAFWTNLGFRRDTNLDPFTAETWEQRRRYRLMMAEPTVKAAFLGKLGSVASQELRALPPQGYEDSEHAKEIADFVQKCLIGPSGTSWELIWEIGHGLLIEGFSICEKLYGYEERGRFKGKWKLEQVKAKDTRNIQIETDRFRNITGLFNQTAGQGGLPFDPNDFVITQYLSFFSNPHGMSDFRASNRAVELITNALKLRTLTLDKNVGPYLKATLKDQKMRQKVEANLKTARANGYIILDSTTDLEVIDLAARGTNEFQQAIDDLRKEIAIGIQGAFLQMLEGMGTDNRGSAAVQKDTSEIFAWVLSVIITGTINKNLVGDIVYPNYGPDAPLPLVQLGAVNPADVLAELQIDQLLMGMKLPLSKSDLYMRANRKPPRDKADTLDPALLDSMAQNVPGMPGLTPELPKPFSEGDPTMQPQQVTGQTPIVVMPVQNPPIGTPTGNPPVAMASSEDQKKKLPVIQPATVPVVCQTPAP